MIASVLSKDVQLERIDSGSFIKRAMASEFIWIWLGTAGLFMVSAFLTPGTIRSASLATMLPFAAILAIAAVGQTTVIQQRGLDMSLPGMMSLAGIAFAKIELLTGSVMLAVILTLLISIAVGTINGLLVTKINITPIVATLATNAVMLGAIRTISMSPMTAPRALSTFSHTSILGLPLTVLLALLFVLLVGGATKWTAVGRRFTAVGANPSAAAAAGIPVGRYQIGTYALAAFCYAVAGILYAGFIGSASHHAGAEYLLPAIAAVVVGGTPFTGGRGSAVASGVAALFMTQLGQMVLALGASTAAQLLVQALALVLAVTIRHLADFLRFFLRDSA